MRRSGLKAHIVVDLHCTVPWAFDDVVKEVERVNESVTRSTEAEHPLRAFGKAAPANPFGRHAGLWISQKSYDRGRASRFRKQLGKWIPFLVAWDATLRLLSGEARICKRFTPGFVLDGQVIGQCSRTESGTSVVYIHPDRFAQVVKAHRERPIAIAAFLHGVACHELTHLDAGRLHADGHDERWIAAREDLAAATGHLRPAIATLVQRTLALRAAERRT